MESIGANYDSFIVHHFGNQPDTMVSTDSAQYKKLLLGTIRGKELLHDETNRVSSLANEMKDLTIEANDGSSELNSKLTSVTAAEFLQRKKQIAYADSIKEEPMDEECPKEKCISNREQTAPANLRSQFFDDSFHADNLKKQKIPIKLEPTVSGDSDTISPPPASGLVAISDAAEETKPMDNRITISGLVMHIANEFACVYSPNLDVSHFYVKSNCLKSSLSSSPLGQWFEMTFSLDSDVRIQSATHLKRWIVSVNQMRELRFSDAPPIFSRLDMNRKNVEVLAELVVGRVCPIDGYRIGYSLELPPIVDVSCQLRSLNKGVRVFAWCSLRRLPYNGCYWRIMSLAKRSVDFYDEGRISRLIAIQTRSFKLLTISEKSVHSSSLPSNVPQSTPATEDSEPENPVLRFIKGSKNEVSCTTSHMLEDDMLGVKKMKKPTIKIVRACDRPNGAPSSSASITNIRRIPYSPSSSKGDEHIGVICAYLQVPGRKKNIVMGQLQPIGTVDYIVQTPELKMVALLKRDVALDGQYGDCFTRDRKAEFAEFTNLIGEWIVFRGRHDGNMLVISEYNIIEACYRTMPTRYNALVSCELDIPKQFDAACDVLFVEQLGAAVFDNKHRVRPQHLGRSALPAVIACQSSVSSPDGLIWWIESLRNPSTGDSTSEYTYH